ncbi:MAG: hypothetical protein GY696_28350 [Gammaproteobacteria bacterium]|nr:hypothetical protein [Gammaproteobacteria bacterium]
MKLDYKWSQPQIKIHGESHPLLANIAPAAGGGPDPSERQPETRSEIQDPRGGKEATSCGAGSCLGEDGVVQQSGAGGNPSPGSDKYFEAFRKSKGQNAMENVHYYYVWHHVAGFIAYSSHRGNSVRG